MLTKLKFLLGDLWSLFLPVIIQAMTSAGTLATKLATKAVIEAAAMTEASGSEKMEHVMSVVLEGLRKEGLNLASSTIRAIIEIVYQKFQDSDELVE
jgi:hypothetical protein